MKTFNNNPPTPFGRLSLSQHNIAIERMAARHDIRVSTMAECIAKGYAPDIDFEFYPLNNDVAVKSKR